MGIPSMVMKNNRKTKTDWYEVSVQILLKDNMDSLEFNEVILVCIILRYCIETSLVAILVSSLARCNYKD